MKQTLALVLSSATLEEDKITLRTVGTALPAGRNTLPMGVETNLLAPADYNGMIQRPLSDTIDMACFGASS